MNKKIIISNTTGTVQFVAGRMLHPGCSMECFEHEAPAHLIPANAKSPSGDAADDRTTADQDDWSAEGFLSQSLRDMEDAGLPDLDMGQLTDLKKVEVEGQNRANVLTSIDAALLIKAKTTA